MANRPLSPADSLLACLLVICANAIGSVRAATVEPLSSPDGRIQVSVKIPAPPSEALPMWTATFRGKQVLKNCELGLQLAEGGELLSGATVVSDERREVNERVPMLFGKAAFANDQFRESRLTVSGRAGRRLTLVMRCYNDAVALRYELPAGEGSVTLADESTSFQIEGAETAWLQVLEHYKTSHEHNVQPTKLADIPEGKLLDLPLTFSWKDGTYAAITEASLRQYAGMALMRSSTSDLPGRLVAKLTPRADGSKVRRPLPMHTPWRVVLIGERPGALLESTTIYCLNEPPATQDQSWIKPGKITFSWWNGDVYGGQRSAPILSLEMASKYIDFCARHGIPTHSMTSTEPPTTPWYVQSERNVAPGPDTDVTRPREGFDLPAVRDYAASKNVRLWTWVHQAALRGRVEEAFAAFEKQGWSGMMVDFFDHDDQETVEFAEDIVQAAARHRILIQLHGVWKPTGWERTYPHVVNHEGALNFEYLKWSDRCTPEHTLRLAFTRLIAGPMDYHLGGFRAVRRSDFKPMNVSPNVLGSRGQMLAMYVCFDNPNPMLADDPAAYEDQPGFDFLKLVPTWWDETRVLSTEIGALLVTARRKGQTWYIGGMSAGLPRDLELSLGFLGTKNFSARIWRDGLKADENPNELSIETMQLRNGDTLKAHLATDGGFVAQLTPAAE